MEGRIATRAFLGEHWDYLVDVPGSPAPLRVSTPPTTRFEAGDPAWLRIDPATIAPVPPPEETR